MRPHDAVPSRDLNPCPSNAQLQIKLCMVYSWTEGNWKSELGTKSVEALKRWSPLKRYTTDQRLFFHLKTDLNGSTLNIEENNAFSA
jgi:hypothetical protein